DTLAGPSDFVNTDYISDDSVDMLFEVDVANINSNYFDSDPTFDILDDRND
ncbi:4763_t:CDS:1, partial [Cetraspora pellucida]